MEKAIKKYLPIFVLPTFLAFLIGFVAPFLLGLWLSLCDFTTVTDATFVGFSNFVLAVQDTVFQHSFWYTALFTVVSVIVINVIAFAIALALTRKLRGTNLFRTVFSKLDQGFPMWEADPQGHHIAGGGIHMTLTDMLKLGQVYLNGGVWHGRRIVGEEWVRMASSKQIDIPVTKIWTCGYGFQFWMSPYPGAYRADGAYGQITTVLPDQGLVVAVQCPETGDFDNVVRPALHEHLLLPLCV